LFRSRLADLADRLADAPARLDLLTHGVNCVRDRLSSRRDTLVRRNDTAALRALDLLGALDLSLLTEAELSVLLDTSATAAHLIAERLVDAGLLESPSFGSYHVPASVRLLARERRTNPAAGQEAVRRVVDHYVEAVRDRVADPVAPSPTRARSAWYRTHRSTLDELSLRDHTDTLHNAVNDLRRGLLDRSGHG
ncbi:MAG: hypothetical protein HOV94_27560, partial [Saccharothrix sp.]|nr:hypothetical protein [Saccharothrix sp.]